MIEIHPVSELLQAVFLPKEVDYSLNIHWWNRSWFVNVSPSAISFMSHFHFSSASLNMCYSKWPPLARKLWVSAHSPHMDDSKQLIYSSYKTQRLQGTFAQVILFVVRMWLKHLLLGLQILYRGQLGGGPVFLEKFYSRKKGRRAKTLRRLIRNRVKVS